MKRGERKKWRELTEIVSNISNASNYAEEYFYKTKFLPAVEDLLCKQFGRTVRLIILDPPTAMTQSEKERAVRLSDTLKGQDRDG